MVTVIVLPQVFSPQPHDRVGALVEVSFADGQIDHGDMGVLISFFVAVVEEDRAAGRFEGEVAEVGGEGGGSGGGAVVAGGRDKMLIKK